MKRWLGIVGFLALFIVVACNGSNEDNTVESVEQVSGIEAQLNAQINALALPDRVSVVLRDGRSIDVSVTWPTGVLDRAGEQTIEGELNLPEDVLNPAGLKARVLVSVIPNTLLDTLASLEDYSVLYAAILTSELDRILALDGPFTLFAPNNQAFEDFFSILGITQAEFLLREDLDEFLLYHILAGNYSENVLIASVPGSVMTLEGSELSLRLRSARIELNQSSLVEDTLAVKNGIIHQVNRVLVSQTVADSVIGDLFDDDLLEMLFELLQDVDIPLDVLLTGSVTVFLPNEEAFNALMDDLDLDEEAFMVLDDLAELLSYHIFAGQYLADQLYNDAPINIRNISGDLLRVDVVDNQLMILDATVLSTETLGDFGLIHVIDRVLIPESLRARWFDQEE